MGGMGEDMTARAELRVLKGEHGADKVFCLAASEQPATATVVLFVGDQLEARHVPSEVLALQVTNLKIQQGRCHTACRGAGVGIPTHIQPHG